jgi:[acyl-carrier-protein] S-malonyltransferase
MGRDWCQAHPAARALLSQAEALLGFSISDLCWNQGEAVHRTDVAQPGIFLTSAMVVTVLRERGLDPRPAAMTAGLSLGEYTALWYAGALAFEDAIRLVRLRGEAMQAASEARPSGMLSLMGASVEQAQTLARAASSAGICQVANLNAPGQVVLSGENAALELAERAAKEHGVRRARRLSVAGGFHSECMRPAAERLKRALAGVRIARPRVPFVSNVSGGPVEDPEQIRTFLADQVCASVRWEDGMRWALAQGVTEFVEPAPGTVLAGLLAKIAPEGLAEGPETPGTASRPRVRSYASPADLGASPADLGSS